MLTDTPPSSKVRKPVTASGILALTRSPLLFKGKRGSASKRTPNFIGKKFCVCSSVFILAS